MLAEHLRRNEERRRERRAFAESVLHCCDILDNIVADYWGVDRDEKNRDSMKVLEQRLLAETQQILGLTTVSMLDDGERAALRGIMHSIYGEMCGDFESYPSAANTARMGFILADITRIRLEVNRMRAG